MISVLTRRVNGGRASKREAGGEKWFEMLKRPDVAFHRKSCQLTDIVLIKHFAFVVEGCDCHAEPDTILLFIRLL